MKMKLTYKILTPTDYEFTGRYKGNRRIYRLKNEVKFMLNGKTIIIPNKFEWDSWTIPPFIDLFFDLTKDPIPALFHDYLYETAGTINITRRQADRLLKAIAISRLNKVHEVNAAYGAVRVFSGYIWRRYKKYNNKH